MFVLFTACGEAPRPQAAVRERPFAFVTNGHSNDVSVLDIVRLEVVATIPVGHNPTDVRARPASTEVYVVATDANRVEVIDAVTRSVVASISVGQRPFFVEFSPDGKRAYVANSGSNTLSVITNSEGEPPPF